MNRRISAARFSVRASLTGFWLVVACGGSSGDPSAMAPASLSSCAFSVTQNVYDAPNYWGTITVKNSGSGSVTGLTVQFSIPRGDHCTNDSVPSGATLSPLTGSGALATTTSNVCKFSWPSQTLAAGASMTFNYSTDSTNFSAATGVTASSSACGGSGSSGSGSSGSSGGSTGGSTSGSSSGSGSSCSFKVTANSYDGPNYWGTMSVENSGPSAATGVAVQFTLPGGDHCTHDTVPSGAALSPLAGSGTSAHTISNACKFTWATSTLAAGASLTFNYSTDSSNFSAASNVSVTAAGCAGGPSGSGSSGGSSSGSSGGSSSSSGGSGSSSGGPASGSAYDQAVLADHPVGYWAMSGTSTEDDLTGNGHTGRYQNGAPGAAALPNGDQAADFDGSGQYLSVPSSASFSIQTTGSLSWEGWIRPDVLQFPNDGGAGYVDWMGKCQDYSPTCEWEARLYSTTNSEGRCNRFSAYAFNPTAGLGSGADWQPTCGLIQPATWYHVVGEYTTRSQPADCANTGQYRGSLNIWVNGVEWDHASHGQTGCMSQYNVAPRAGSSPLNVGTMARDGWFPGAVGKVAIYPQLLTQAQITSHYRAMTGKTPAGSCGDTCSF